MPLCVVHQVSRLWFEIDLADPFNTVGGSPVPKNRRFLKDRRQNRLNRAVTLRSLGDCPNA